MGYMVEYRKAKLIAEFISENWSLFVDFCKLRGDDPEDIFEGVNFE